MENKKKLFRILLPLLILAVIAGIWVIKSGQKEEIKEQVKTAANPDFALLATEINLEKLKSYGLPIMIDFGSDSCPPCREMAPILREVNAEYQGRVIVVYGDIERYPKLAEGFPLEVIPTQFFFTKEGKPYVPAAPNNLHMQLFMNRDTKEHVLTAHQGFLSKKQIQSVFKELGVSDVK